MKIKHLKTHSLHIPPLIFAILASVTLLSGVTTMKVAALSQDPDQTVSTALDQKKIWVLPSVLKTTSQTSSQQAVTKALQIVAIQKAQAKVAQDATKQQFTSTTKASISPSSKSLYVDPKYANEGRPTQISSKAIATWFGGWNANVQADVSALVGPASANNQLATLVAYNIPSRDCGSYSAGGAGSSSAYRSWIQAFASGIGARQAIVILEPDALPGLDCLSAGDQAQRLSDLSFAVTTLAGTGAITYLDAGNYSWQSVSVMTQRLQSANIASARGFSLNVSGYGWTDKSIAYGSQLSKSLGGKGFVIDTSRNGNGPTSDNQWCNPRGRALGLSPTTNTGVANLDAYLWLKVPGESDGTCNGGPSAGEWWPDLANELIQNAH